MSASVLIIGKGDTKTRVPIHVTDDGDLVLGVVAPPASGETAPDNSASTAVETSRVIKASAGVLLSVTVANPTVDQVYLLLFDATSLPANGEIPVDYSVVPSGFVGGLDYGSLGRAFDNGIVAAISSTLGSLTISSASYLFSARFS